jgi:hypothetical protein
MHECRAGALLALVLLTSACGGDDPNAIDASSDSSRIDVVREFGAIPDGTTDNEPMVQAALDQAAAAGGGTVYLRTGTYGISKPLIVGSNTNLVGDGPGRSVLRALVPAWGKIAQAAGVYSAIGTVAAEHATIRDLTVDLSFAGTNSNGVSLLPAGVHYEGTPSSHCEVSNIEVIGAGDRHAYMIWNMRGRDIRIVNNRIDGRVATYLPGSSQEGIESYGGEDVFIAWNTIQNIGNAALNFGSAGLPDTTIDGLEVIGNRVTNSAVGLHIGTWRDETGPHDVFNVSISDNDFTNLWRTGVDVLVFAHTEMRGLHITDNRLINIGTPQVSGTGISLQTYAADAENAAAVTDNSIQGNIIQSVHGPNAVGLIVDRFPNLVVSGNAIDDVESAGVFAASANDLTLQENTFANLGTYGLISFGAPSGVYLRENTFQQWDRSGQGFPGVVINDATRGEVRGNSFTPRDLGVTAVSVEASAANIVVFGNQVVAANGQSLSALSGAPQFVNKGTNSNLGSFATTAGATTISVANPLVQPTSTVVIAQLAGAQLTGTVVPGTASFQVTFGTTPAGDEVFNYEIDP